MSASAYCFLSLYSRSTYERILIDCFFSVIFGIICAKFEEYRDYREDVKDDNVAVWAPEL